MDYKTFKEFWPFYLSQHQNPRNRKLHFIGSSFAILFLVFTLWISFWFFLLALVSGYGFAWYGHFIIEKNRPATFIYPIFSLMGDFKMFFYILTGKLDQEIKRTKKDI